MHIKKTLISAAVLVSLLPFALKGQGLAPTGAVLQALFQKGQAFEQDLVLTAYYSPLPNQCCYVKGSLSADIELNGGGTHGADGTSVYAGMVAAPPSYPYGTRIVLPGIGTVTVHDRGGAIQEWNDAHRVDVWVGYGEEGLARALAFGVQRVHATVYPTESVQPTEKMVLADLEAPPSILRPYVSDETTLLDIHAALNEVTVSVQLLQERLQALGYFDQKPTGKFGPTTMESLKTFYKDMQMNEPADHLTEAGAAVIEAAYDRREAEEPVPQIVDDGSSPSRISAAQRTLRFLDAYNGRTNGVYDEKVKSAVFAFQKQHGLVSNKTDPGAGRIGPMTRKTIIVEWKRAHAHLNAQHLLAMRKIDQLITQKGYELATFLKKGDRGANVRQLQQFLVTKGFLKKSDVTGSFGSLTVAALTKYQLAKKIIEKETDTGAGFAGPATLMQYRRDVRSSLLKIVRAKGWAAV